MWHRKARFHTQCRSWVLSKPWCAPLRWRCTLEDGLIVCCPLFWSQIGRTCLHQKPKTDGNCRLWCPRQRDAPPRVRPLVWATETECWGRSGVLKFINVWELPQLGRSQQSGKKMATARSCPPPLICHAQLSVSGIKHSVRDTKDDVWVN